MTDTGLQMLKAIIIGCLALTVVQASCQAPNGVQTAVRRVDEPGTGDEWQSWSQQVRELFVYAYVRGYRHGKTDACTVAARAFAPKVSVPFRDSEKLPLNRCLHESKHFTKPMSFYTDTLTEFYRRYPEDRVVPAAFLLRALADEGSVSVDELHGMAQTGELVLE